MEAQTLIYAKDTLEEGRVALNELERRLKASQRKRIPSAPVHRAPELEISDVVSRSSYSSERRNLDKVSRNARLDLRNGSPFGMTLEEMDDRGLLEGGASVPPLLSIKQRGRRHQEMRQRSQRLQHREKDNVELFLSLYHMLRALLRRGINVVAMFHKEDQSNNHNNNNNSSNNSNNNNSNSLTGIIPKRRFIAILKDLCLPFMRKDLSTIVKRYTLETSIDECNYQDLFDDAGVSSMRDGHVVLDSGSLEGDASLDIPEKPTNVLTEVRALLRESVVALGKSVDHVYRMFARWDHAGVGYVTATQFVRVLTRLHVNLSDQDQDFLVELLDTKGDGRIHFEALVSYCFSDMKTDSGSATGTGSIETGMSATGRYSAGTNSIGDDLVNDGISLYSREREREDRDQQGDLVTKYNSNDTRVRITSAPTQLKGINDGYGIGASHGIKTSGTSDNNNSSHQASFKRPHTASSSRRTATDNHMPQREGMYSYNMLGSITSNLGHGLDGYDSIASSGVSPKSPKHKRPLTASARVSSYSIGAKSNEGSPPEQNRFEVIHGGPDEHHNDETDVDGSGNLNVSESMNQIDQQHGQTWINSDVNVDVKRSNDSPNRSANGLNAAERMSAPMGDTGHGTGPEDDRSYNDNTMLTEIDDFNVNGLIPSGANQGQGGGAQWLRQGQSQTHILNWSSNHNNINYNNLNHHNTLDSPSSLGVSGLGFPASGPLSIAASLTTGQGLGVGLSAEQEDMDMNANGSIGFSMGLTNDMDMMSPSPLPSPARPMTNREGNHRNGNTNSQGNNDNMHMNVGINTGITGAGGTAIGVDPLSAPQRPWLSPQADDGDPDREQEELRQQFRLRSRGAPTHTTNNIARSGDIRLGPANDHHFLNLDSAVAPPTEEHLSLLANQTLQTLREMILARRNTGKSFKDIFLHFARREAQFFDAVDLIQAASDLGIEIGERVAELAVAQIAIDGGSKVSFGEFMVFVTDTFHNRLEFQLQQAVGNALERRGREFQSLVNSIFWVEASNMNEVQSQNGTVSEPTFKSALSKLGLNLKAVDINRLAMRFNVHGEGQCSVVRFLRMTQMNDVWLKAEKALALQEEASEEAQNAIMQLQQARAQGRDPPAPLNGLNKEVIRMAEYLHIRVLSEPQLIWIAVEAYKAPLPEGWSNHQDASGRTYFFHANSRTSRWDHPMDPHFRKLRDQYRDRVNNNALPTSHIDVSNDTGLRAYGQNSGGGLNPHSEQPPITGISVNNNQGQDPAMWNPNFVGGTTSGGGGTTVDYGWPARALQQSYRQNMESLRNGAVAMLADAEAAIDSNMSGGALPAKMMNDPTTAWHHRPSSAPFPHRMRMLSARAASGRSGSSHSRSGVESSNSNYNNNNKGGSGKEKKKTPLEAVYGMDQSKTRQTSTQRGSSGASKKGHNRQRPRPMSAITTSDAIARSHIVGNAGFRGVQAGVFGGYDIMDVRATGTHLNTRMDMGGYIGAGNQEGSALSHAHTRPTSTAGFQNHNQPVNFPSPQLDSVVDRLLSVGSTVATNNISGSGGQGGGTGQQTRRGVGARQGQNATSNANSRLSQGRALASTSDGANNIDDRVTSMYTDGVINQLDNLILGASSSGNGGGPSTIGDMNVNVSGAVTSTAAMTLRRGDAGDSGEQGGIVLV